MQIERYRVPLLALAVVAAAVLFQHRRQQNPEVTYTRFDLPAFDAYVHVAMAEHPAVFTVAPWGYRVLTAWVVRALPVPKVIRGFRVLTVGALIGSGLAVFVYLRRLGHGQWPALLAVAVFGLSDPVAEVLGHDFRTEPLSLLLTVVFLCAVEGGAGLGVLSLLMTLGACAGEIVLLLVPLVLLDRWRRDGARSGLIAALLVAAPGIAATLLLRMWWVPHVEWMVPSLVPDGTWKALGTVLAGRREPLWPLAILGVLAAAGALRRSSRRFLHRYGYLVAATGVLALLAGLQGGQERASVQLVYALPVWLPLALAGLGRRFGPSGPPPRMPNRPIVERVATLATLGVLVLLPFGLDRYRRIDLRGSGDGPLALALSRESRRAAGRLERGGSVSFDAVTNRYAWGFSDPGTLGRMRWFLRAGWGPLAHYGIHHMEMRASQASLLLPCYTPQGLEVAVVMHAPRPVSLTAFVNGRALGRVQAGPGAPESVLRVPTETLFRGDNVLTLVARGGVPESVRLQRLIYRPAPFQ